MSTNNKGRAPGKEATQNTFDSQNQTANDPLIDWFNVAHPARNRQQKRTSCAWQKVGG